MGKYHFYSIGQSFGEGTKGRESRKIVTTSGGRESLGGSLWTAGDQSYAVLKATIQEENGSSVNIDDDIDDSVDHLIDQADRFLCHEFFPTLLEMLDQEMIVLANGDKSSLVKAWAKYQLADRFLMFSQFIDGNPFAFKEAPDFVPFPSTLAAIAVLTLIDDACLCILSEDQEGLVHISMDIERCKAYLAPPTKLFVALDMAVKMAVTEKASKGAQAKLANDPKQKDKALVREWWNDWQKNDPTRYKNKSACARDMLDKFPNLESQRVITDKWCSAWEKENITLPAR